MALTLEIITPEQKLYSETAEEVTLPTVMGEAGILPGHVPVLFQLAPGELKVTRNGSVELLAVDKGFAEVVADKISVLTEQAIDQASIDLDAVAQAEEKARAAVKAAADENLSEQEIKALEDQLMSVERFAVIQKLLKKR